MRVLIDGHMLSTNEGGNERYIKNLVKELQKIKKINLKVFVNRDFPPKANEIYIRDNYNNDLIRLLYSLPKAALRNHCQLVHSTYLTPFIKTAKFVATVHDFSFKRFPHFYNMREQVIFQILLPFSLKRTDAIIVPSKFTKNEAVNFYPQYQEKIHVIYEAADENFHPLPKKQALSKVSKKFAIKHPFLLTLNSKNPKKNINRVIAAFKIVKKSFPKLNLVIVGGNHNIDNQHLCSEGVKILDNISDKSLNILYNACIIFIYYSIYEGFGLPILEALKCETPVIGSNLEVHQEIAKDSILYADPFDERQLAEKIEQLLIHRRFAQKLAKQGAALVKKYSWQNTAKETLAIYQSVLNDAK